MKILTLNPPYFHMYSRSSRSPAVTKSNTLYYPIYLAYATGLLEKNGFDVTLLDAPAMGMDRDATVAAAERLNPSLVVVDTSTPSIENDVAVASAIKRRCPRATIVLVGTHVSAMPEESVAVSENTDAVARKEYDLTLIEVASRLGNSARDFSGVAGLTYRNGSGNVLHNPDRSFIEDLDSLPFVSSVYKRHLSSCLSRYFYGANLYPVLAILSGRGCPHQCSFCVYPQTMTGNRYRVRSVGNTVDELEYIKRELPEVREVFLEDDTLTANRHRARELAEEILRRGLKITWSTNSRADADFETLRLIHKSGCRLLCVGFESADQTILDSIGKHLTVERIYQFADDARRAGLLIHGCFVVGNQGETRESLEKTLEMAKALPLDTAQFFPIMVYPGTKAYQWARSNNYITARSFREWLTPDGLHRSVVSTPNLSAEELGAFCDRARREFYLRPRYLFSKARQVARAPTEAGRLFRAGRTLSRFLFRSSETPPKRKC